MNGLSEAFNYPSHPDFRSLLQDLMHKDYLNQFINEFSLLSKMLSRGLVFKTEDLYWIKVRNEFKAYCDLNGISAYYGFDDFSSWKGTSKFII
jgi:hypothetical protein